MPTRTWLFLLLLAVAWPAAGEETAPATPDPQRVLARVYGEPITAADVLDKLKRAHPQAQRLRESPEGWSQLMRAGLDAKIRDRLLLHAAREAGTQISDQTLEQALQHTREKFGPERYQRLLRERGTSEQAYAEHVRQRLLIQKFLSERVFANIDITEQDVAGFYEHNQDAFTAPARARLAFVFVPEQDLAQSIVQRLREGADFAEVVDEISEQQERPLRSQVGWVPMQGMPAALREQVQAAEAGTVLDPVQSPHGFQVVAVQDKQDAAVRSLEDVREDLGRAMRQRQQQRVLQQWYAAMLPRADIEYVDAPEKRGRGTEGLNVNPSVPFSL